METSNAKEYPGSCHCGAIRYVYSTNVAPENWQVRCCMCSFCRAHGARNTSDSEGSITFVESDPERSVRYRFGLRTADFLVCASCGVYVAAVLGSPRGSYATVNVNTLAKEPAGIASPVPAEYGAETVAERITRRERLWTPVAEGSQNLPNSALQADDQLGRSAPSLARR